MFKNKNKNKKQCLIFLSLGFIFVLPGCFNKVVEDKSVDNQPVAVIEDKNVEKEQDIIIENNEDDIDNVIVKDGDTKPIEENGDEIDTSDWLTYRNEEYGFEVEYPDGWVIKSPAYDNLLRKDDNVYHVLGLAPKNFHGDWVIGITVIPDTINNVLNNPNYYWKKNWDILDRKSVFIGSWNVEDVTWSNGVHIFYVQNFNKFLTIQFDGFDYSTNRKITELDLIISSLKFFELKD